MALEQGTRIGPYEIQAAIGAGGMGDVYRARDMRLNRDVAIKVLSDAFASDRDRIVRFEREAQVLAALNHPNIAAIHGVGDTASSPALILEFVEGPTLAERIARGPLSLDDALPVARQIADALEAAHEVGVIHRDLKPANIKLRPDGIVKVLDFGLAKVVESAGSSQSMASTLAPTITSPALTGLGVILGTAAYMSPEQARGREADKRSDVWAFGCVLYEMLTGARAFDGTEGTDVLVAVLSQGPDWTRLPAATPSPIRRLLRRCLVRDRRERLADMSTVRLEITEALSPSVSEATTAAPATPRRTRPRLVGLALAASFAALATVAYLARPIPMAHAVRATISPPGGWVVGGARGVTTALLGGIPPEARFALSPDGLWLAFVASDASGRRLVWLRRTDSLAAQALDGTDGAVFPFWSPDSRSIAFFADGRLKRIDTSGGTTFTICDVQGTVLGGTWGSGNVILFSILNPKSPLWRVAPSGGTPSEVTSNASEMYGSPIFLPDGRRFLYLALSGQAQGTLQPQGVYLGAVDSGERRLIVSTGSNTAYANGYLLYLRERTLVAQRFDVDDAELTGEAIPVADQIQTLFRRTGGFSVSQTGVLAYQTDVEGEGQLAWFDRGGKRIADLGEPGTYEFVELSPDDRRASISVLDSTTNTHDIWILDVVRGVRTRFTSSPVHELSSAWSPDGDRIVFNSSRNDSLDLYVGSSNAWGEGEAIEESASDKYSYSWSPDGRFLLYGTPIGGQAPGGDIFVKPLFGAGAPLRFLATLFNESGARFSPDGRWVVYQSDESGRNEVYVAPFPQGPGKVLVSRNGGFIPRWRRDGREIFYLAFDGTLMAAQLDIQDATLEIGEVRSLFQTRTGGARVPYAVAGNGERFLVITATDEDLTRPITLVVNWLALLNR